MLLRSVVGLLVVLFFSCNSGHTPKYALYYGNPHPAADTFVCRKDITKSIAGAAYKEKVYQYFLLVGKDTMDFTCYISNSRLNDIVYIDMHMPDNRKTTYNEKVNGLKKILPLASRDFNLQNIKSLRIGQLIETGDLAIDITKQYQARFGDHHSITDYNTISDFLKESKLGTDLNHLFKPYSIGITNIDVEKVAFTTKAALYKSSNLETDFSMAPDKILDCMTWITLRHN